MRKTWSDKPTKGLCEREATRARFKLPGDGFSRGGGIRVVNLRIPAPMEKRGIRSLPARQPANHPGRNTASQPSPPANIAQRRKRRRPSRRSVECGLPASAGRLTGAWTKPSRATVASLPVCRQRARQYGVRSESTMTSNSRSWPPLTGTVSPRTRLASKADIGTRQLRPLKRPCLEIQPRGRKASTQASRKRPLSGIHALLLPKHAVPGKSRDHHHGPTGSKEKGHEIRLYADPR